MEFHRPHKTLDVWKAAMELCQDVYRVTERLPEGEKYGLVAQIRRAAISIPSNIAEGAGRNSLAEFSQFLSIAQGSLAELDTQLELCGKYLGFLDEQSVTELQEKVERISRMATALRRSLKTNEVTSPIPASPIPRFTISRLHNSRFTTSRFTTSRLHDFDFEKLFF